ncbi:MAG: GNAT family N-acetyltransferase [Anaerolineales bacterium]|nr:GNAT family N-acetyltransferase [Anaerolineales bacterium]
MVTPPTLAVRTATPEDIQSLANLIHFDSFVHRHLDYRPPLSWVGERPFPLLCHDGEIVAALACPTDPPHVAWIHLFAASYQITPDRAWDRLWTAGLEQLAEDSIVSCAAAIPLHEWFEKLLKKSRFERTHAIVMLRWNHGAPLPKAYLPTGAILRPMTPEDLPEVQVVDKTAFVPVWQNSLVCLEYALRQAAVATVVALGEHVVAYQISTATPMGGHLARLAVLPELQGQGIGYALVRDLLAAFEQSGAQTVTVNTQQKNEPSLAIYRKAGFQLTGEQYPIYQLEIP